MGSRADLEAGFFFVVFGGATVAISSRYSLGRAMEMGPGYFPLVLGGLLVAIGLVVLVRGFIRRGASSIEPVNYKAVAAVTASIVLFGALILTAGLLVAIPVTVLVSLLAANTWSWRGAIGTALVLTVMCYLVFVVGLDLRIPALGGY